ncbi:MAG: ubiquitin-like protein Pup [Actinomycetes bacterium]|jgi:ubiquitin-like protein Pup
MTEQERIQTPASDKKVETESIELVANATKNEQLKNDLDTLLDEIDEVLEDNAEEFVRNYVQKGGE